MLELLKRTVQFPHCKSTESRLWDTAEAQRWENVPEFISESHSVEILRCRKYLLVSLKKRSKLLFWNNVIKLGNFPSSKKNFTSTQTGFSWFDSLTAVCGAAAGGKKKRFHVITVQLSDFLLNPRWLLLTRRFFPGVSVKLYVKVSQHTEQRKTLKQEKDCCVVCVSSESALLLLKILFCSDAVEMYIWF